MIEKIQKRDGRIIMFDPQKITRAIFLAASAVAKQDGVETDYETAERLTDQVVAYLNSIYKDETPTVEQVQDAVVRVLIETGHVQTSEAYILYRSERSRVRNLKSRMMKSIRAITYDSEEENDNDITNAHTALRTMMEYGKIVSREYCLANVIKPLYAKGHEKGAYHINDLSFLNMGTLESCQIDIERLFNGGFSVGQAFFREPKDITSYAALCAVAIQANQNDMHGEQSIPAFDYYMANGVKKTFRKKYLYTVKNAAELITGIKLEYKDLDKAFGKDICMEMSEKQLESISSGIAGMCKEQSADVVKRIMDFAYQDAFSETDRKTYQAMEGLIHNLNAVHSYGGAELPMSSVNFGTDTSPEGRMVIKNLLLSKLAGLGNGMSAVYPHMIFKYKKGINTRLGEPNYDLFRLSLRVCGRRQAVEYLFLDAPFNRIHRKSDREIAAMHNRTRLSENQKGRNSCISRGADSATIINLPRLGIKHGLLGTEEKFDKADFFNELDEVFGVVVSQLLERQMMQGSKRVSNFPFLMGQGIWMGSDHLDWNEHLEKIVTNGTLEIGIIGLAECLTALVGKNQGQREDVQQLGIEIVEHMHQKCIEASKKYGSNFTLIAAPAACVGERLVKIDRRKYGKIKGVTDGKTYTDSFMLPEDSLTNNTLRIKLEAPYHSLTNGGHICFIRLTEKECEDFDLIERNIKEMAEAGIGMGSIKKID